MKKMKWFLGDKVGGREVDFFLDIVLIVKEEGDIVQTRWCRLVPIKLNVLLWRFLRDRIPTRGNLVKRGIDIHSILCPMCSLQSEDCSHTFVKCEIANQIWDKVFKWLDLPFLLFNDVLELFIWIDSLRIKKKKKNVVEVICIVVIWVL
ncbi:unnamed protein product [Lactuca saligna]|uniref:Reverse transcriptase zinc-binding domain-containing protein n=1 Tax=Lactuca saligna TaxID=75948 RepID=A0AA36DZJ5_LACSI|nr:unnamed protein product [Lactuca saligna]